MHNIRKIFKKSDHNSSTEKIPSRVIIKYTLLQLPEIFVLLTILIWLNYFEIISLAVLTIIMLFWLLKDIILFFYVWQAYDVPEILPVTGSAVAVEDLNPAGYVQVGSELWRATVPENHESVKKGQDVIITGHKGLTLIVTQKTDRV